MRSDLPLNIGGHVWSHIKQEHMDQPGKVDNPARGQLNKDRRCNRGNSILYYSNISLGRRYKFLYSVAQAPEIGQISGC